MDSHESPDANHIPISIPAELLERVDTTNDAQFYELARLVTHVDDPTIAALTHYLSEVIPPNARVVDLMSSWISHLPGGPFAEVACLGMNAEELQANPVATRWCIHDLNEDPRLPYDDTGFDCALISFSMQYLTDPVAVLSDIARTLTPGGQLVIALSHRCFPTKAIRAFHVLPPTERIRFVMHCLHLTGKYAAPEFIDRSPEQADPLWIVTATTLP